MANKGHYYRPHLVTSMGDKKIVLKILYLNEKHLIQYVEVVHNGMQAVLEEGGTALRSRIADVVVCGKRELLKTTR